MHQDPDNLGCVLTFGDNRCYILLDMALMHTPREHTPREHFLWVCSQALSAGQSAYKIVRLRNEHKERVVSVTNSYYGSGTSNLIAAAFLRPAKAGTQAALSDSVCQADEIKPQARHPKRVPGM